MKKVLFAILLLISCNKLTDIPMKSEFKKHLEKIDKSKRDKFQGCDFGVKEFNQQKRKLSTAEEINANRPSEEVIKGKKGRGGGGGNSGGGNNNSTPCILLTFDGYLVENTSWNYAGPINCAPANLTTQQVDDILINVSNEYAPYKVTVTTDPAIYVAAPTNKRIRLVLTETWEWYGQAGGVAFINSFTWGDNTPCFVFTSLLNYSTKFIKEAASHEIGHTLGLLHQSKWSEDCIKLAEYNTGNGVEAPIMGIGYYVPDNGSKWWIGPTPYSCTNIQDDNRKLTQMLGLR